MRVQVKGWVDLSPGGLGGTSYFFHLGEKGEVFELAIQEGTTLIEDEHIHLEIEKL